MTNSWKQLKRMYLIQTPIGILLNQQFILIKMN